MLFPQHEIYRSVHILANPSLAIAKSLIGTDDTVASGSETQDTNLIGMGMKQMG